MIFALVLALFASWFILHPVFSSITLQPVAERDLEDQNLINEEIRCIQSLRDLDFDYRSGRISKSDYDESKGIIATELQSALNSRKVKRTF